MICKGHVVRLNLYFWKLALSLVWSTLMGWLTPTVPYLFQPVVPISHPSPICPSFVHTIIERCQVSALCYPKWFLKLSKIHFGGDIFETSTTNASMNHPDQGEHQQNWPLLVFAFTKAVNYSESDKSPCFQKHRRSQGLHRDIFGIWIGSQSSLLPWLQIGCLLIRKHAYCENEPWLTNEPKSETVSNPSPHWSTAICVTTRDGPFWTSISCIGITLNIGQKLSVRSTVSVNRKRNCLGRIRQKD